MASSKKQPRRRSLRLTLFLGILTLLLGAFLGVLSLATQKVEEVAQIPPLEERKPGVVYLLRGDDAPQARWRRLRNSILRGDPGEAEFTEAGLNAWARNQLKAVRNRDDRSGPSADSIDGVERSSPETPPEEGDVAESTNDSWVPAWLQLEIIPSPPNFAFLEERLQIVVYLEVPALGRRKFVYRVVGDFQTGEDGLVRFVPQEGSIGRAPLGNMPGVNQVLNEFVLGLYKASSEWKDLEEAWARIDSIQVGDEALTVRVR